MVESQHVETEFGVTIMTIYYEIRVAGPVPPGALRGFEQLAADQPAETVVRGPLPDQAALNGLLVRFESSGIQVLRVRRQKRRSSGPHHGTDPGE